MKTIKYIKGDATETIDSGDRCIIHICNDIGLWGAGFVLSLSKKWPQPGAAYRILAASEMPGMLGETQEILVQPGLWVINLIAQRGVRSSTNKQPLDYNVLRSTLLKEVDFIKSKCNSSVHMPRIGCGLGGGKWNDVKEILESTLCLNDIQVTVYDIR
mgnify:CR=1 FL=1